MGKKEIAWLDRQIDSAVQSMNNRRAWEQETLRKAVGSPLHCEPSHDRIYSSWTKSVRSAN